MDDDVMSDSDMSYEEMNEQEGGRRRHRTMRKKGKKSHKGGKSRRKHSKKTHKRGKTMKRKSKKQKGGFLAGAMGAAREALLPLIMFGAQKHQQRRTSKK